MVRACLNEGDTVRVTYADGTTRPGVITYVDDADNEVPYRVLFSDAGADRGYAVWVGVGFARVTRIEAV